MVPLLSKIPHALNAQKLTCRAIIETPSGSHAKYKFNEGCGAFELGKVLPASMSFPLNFGFVPSTHAEDGDPLDVLVLSEYPLPMGCMATVRLVGAMVAEQTQNGKTVRNDRLIARLREGTRYAGVDEMDQLGQSFANELTRFFTLYNELRGRRFEVLSVGGPERAVELVKATAI